MKSLWESLDGFETIRVSERVRPVLKAGTILVLRIRNIRDSGTWSDFGIWLSLIMEHTWDPFSRYTSTFLRRTYNISGLTYSEQRSFGEACFILAGSTRKVSSFAFLVIDMGVHSVLKESDSNICSCVSK